jgi:hypothetical protein
MVSQPYTPTLYNEQQQWNANRECDKQRQITIIVYDPF